MLAILCNNIFPGEQLFADDFPTGPIEDRWEITGGEWTAKDGILTVFFRGNGGGLIYSRQQFPGDIMLDYYGQMVSPCDNDLNFTFRANGWDYVHNDASIGYIGGLNGWWNKHAGIEKYPGCHLQALSGFHAESDREYHIQTGIIGSTCFLAVDGELVIALSDPDPISNPACNRVGLGTYCSMIRVRDFRVYRAVREKVNRIYTAKF